jgi:hypothetical protein
VEGAGVKDTAAYKVIRQIVDHVYGSDEKLSDEETVAICHAFHAANGSWVNLMGGDMRSVRVLEDVLEAFMESRKLSRVATRVFQSW